MMIRLILVLKGGRDYVVVQSCGSTTMVVVF